MDYKITTDDCIDRKFIIEPKKVYAREYYLKNRLKKVGQYNKYYKDNKNTIMKKRTSNKSKLPTEFRRIYQDVIMVF